MCQFASCVPDICIKNSNQCLQLPVQKQSRRKVMDHVVYLDAKAKELENLLSGKKTMVIRGAAGRKLPSALISLASTVASVLQKYLRGFFLSLISILNFEEYHQDLMEGISLLRFYQKIRKFESIVLWLFLLTKPLISCLLSKGYVSLKLFDFYKLGLFIEQKRKISKT